MKLAHIALAATATAALLMPTLATSPAHADDTTATPAITAGPIYETLVEGDHIKFDGLKNVTDNTGVALSIETIYCPDSSPTCLPAYYHNLTYDSTGEVYMEMPSDTAGAQQDFQFAEQVVDTNQNDVTRLIYMHVEHYAQFKLHRLPGNRLQVVDPNPWKGGQHNLWLYLYISPNPHAQYRYAAEFKSGAHQTIKLGKWAKGKKLYYSSESNSHIMLGGGSL